MALSGLSALQALASPGCAAAPISHSVKKPKPAPAPVVHHVFTPHVPTPHLGHMPTTGFIHHNITIGSDSCPPDQIMMMDADGSSACTASGIHLHPDTCAF
eukprot:TRINITY_DN6346_c2_g1_i2.p2 TRINITY_DN6346_c2_g1~~TRINITY_DN6346_c2_g1_i2.p2  ORF type:complete len:109 (+),score=24.46 TRINITY_DN6346_c2_g1_i2:27-329(+)